MNNQGTKLYISREVSNSGLDVQVSRSKPGVNTRSDGSVYYNGHDVSIYLEPKFAELIGLHPGELKQFLITELNDHTEFHSTELTELYSDTGAQISVGCITPEARGLLDKCIEEWEKHFAKRKERNPKDEPSIYGFAYWLIRWSGLIRPVNSEVI